MCFLGFILFLMEKKIEDIVNEIFNEAQNGVIYIEDIVEPSKPWKFYIKFLTKIEGNSNNAALDCPVIEIPSWGKFLKQIESYLKLAVPFYILEKAYFGLSDESYVKKLICDLLSSGRAVDFINIFSYIETRKQQLINKVDEGEIYLGKYQDYEITSKIVKNVSNLEGPYRFCPKFTSPNDESFVLPRVTFGIANDAVYVYALQAKKEKQISSAAKTLDRHFRKVNKGVSEDSFLHNVSPNALISFTLFNSYIRSMGKTLIVSPIFMPIRFNARSLADDNRKTKISREELTEIQYRDQYNITNKLAYMLYRYAFHFPSSNANYDDNTQTVYLNLGENQPNNEDNIIYKINNTALKALSSSDEEVK